VIPNDFSQPNGWNIISREVKLIAEKWHLRHSRIGETQVSSKCNHSTLPGGDESHGVNHPKGWRKRETSNHWVVTWHDSVGGCVNPEWQVHFWLPVGGGFQGWMVARRVTGSKPAPLRYSSHCWDGYGPRSMISSYRARVQQMLGDVCYGSPRFENDAANDRIANDWSGVPCRVRQRSSRWRSVCLPDFASM